MRWRTLNCLAACLCLSTISRADEISLAGDFGEPRVAIAAPDDKSVAHVAWPKVATAPDGTLIVAAIAGRFHGTHGGGCPVVVYSTDGGTTFSPLRVLKRYDKEAEFTSAGNCAIGVAPDGAVVLLSMAFNGELANTIDGWRSVDSGRSWQPIDVSRIGESRTGSVFGNVIQVPGKGLAVVGHYRKPARKHNGDLWMAWSSDNGQSWGDPLSIQIDTKLRLTEPAVTFAEGRFVGLIRTNSDSYAEMISSDDGATWKMKAEGLKTDAEGKVVLPSPCLVSDPENPGRLLALVSERHGGDREEGLLGRVVLWESHVSELNWRKLGDVARFPVELGNRKDITYAWMSPLGGGEWFAVFYCGLASGASDIYGLKFRVPSGR